MQQAVSDQARARRLVQIKMIDAEYFDAVLGL
jgi:hypothetical protein